MGGTRIMVLQMKQIIRTVIFAIIGLALIIALIWFIAPKNDKDKGAALYTPGTYSAQIILHNKPVSVNVTVTKKQITEIELADMEETQEVFYPLFKPTMELLSKEIIKAQTTLVTPSQDSAITGRILLDAVNTALARAKLPDTE